MTEKQVEKKLNRILADLEDIKEFLYEKEEVMLYWELGVMVNKLKYRFKTTNAIKIKNGEEIIDINDPAVQYLPIIQDLKNELGIKDKEK